MQKDLHQWTILRKQKKTREWGKEREVVCVFILFAESPTPWQCRTCYYATQECCVIIPARSLCSHIAGLAPCCIIWRQYKAVPMNYLQEASSLLSFRLPFNPSWFIFVCPVYLSYTAVQHLSHAFLSQFQIMASNLANWRKIKIYFLWIPTRLNGTVRSPVQRRKSYFWRSQVRASSYNSNKSTKKMQQFHKFITWCLCVAQHVWGVSAHHQEHTTALGASGFTVGVWWLERCWS